MLRIPRTLLAAALACCCFPAPAQFVAAKITFRNPGPYSHEELQDTCMLLTGEHTGTPGIQAATQRLMDTGYFDDIQVDTKGTRDALEVIFILKLNPPGHSTPAVFENFVWLTPQELQAALHKAAPLFRGELPEAGNQLDAITNGLKSALAAKGVAGAQISHDLVLPTTARPTQTYAFRVESPSVRVHSITLTGGLPQFAAQEAALQPKLRGTPYDAGQGPSSTAHLLLRPYLDAGFLDARLEDVSTAVTQTASDGVQVDVTATVVSGEPYHVGSIRFAGSPLVTAEAFQAAAKLHAGDVASRGLLLQTLDAVDTPYRRQGYMDEYADAGPVLDAAAHTVSYTVTVKPGEQYRVGTVTTLNLSPEAKAQFDLAWTMKPGDLYNPDYIGGFLGNNRSFRALAGYSASFQGIGDPQTHRVDVTLRFVPISGR